MSAARPSTWFRSPPAGWSPPGVPTSTGCWPASSSTPARYAPTSRRSPRGCRCAAGSCPVASELFAISADAHLILGHLTPAEYSCATPDGRPATLEFARERVARLVCADAEQLAVGEIDAIAAFLHSEQVNQIEAAVQRVSARLEGDPPVVPLGTGAFLAREVADRLGRAVVELSWSAAERDAAPAAALAELVAGRPRPRC